MIVYSALMVVNSVVCSPSTLVNYKREKTENKKEDCGASCHFLSHVLNQLFTERRKGDEGD